MSGKPPKLLYGLHKWVFAILDAALDASEKSLCHALARSADYETGETYSSVETLARGSGLSDRTVPRVMDRLRVKGVVKDVYRSKGGRRDRRFGITNRVRLSHDGLLALNPDTMSGFKGVIERDQPCHTALPTLTQSANNPVTVSDNQSIDQRLDQTNTTTVQTGGGGGALSLRSKGEVATEASDAEPDDSVEEALNMLLAFGVKKRKAQKLARRGAREIDAGIRWVTQNASDANSPAGLLVSAIEDGTAAEELKRQVREEERRARERLAEQKRADERRIAGEAAEREAAARKVRLGSVPFVQNILDWAAGADAPEETKAAAQSIRAAWPDLRAFVFEPDFDVEEVNDLYARQQDEDALASTTELVCRWAKIAASKFGMEAAQ